MSDYALATVPISIIFGLLAGDSSEQLTLRMVFVMIVSELFFRVYNHFFASAKPVRPADESEHGVG